MKPIEFDGVNRRLSPPAYVDYECTTLPVYYDRKGETCLSCWKPTLKERLSILFRGRVWLWVKAGNGTQPPVSIEGR